MTLRSLGRGAVTTLAAVVVVSLLLGAVLGQPVLLSFVETGSMSPTLDPGDGFVAVPAALAGPVEPGDVVTFRAERLHGGGLVTHRVVGETERGYVTRGDANPATDQAGSEPPVRDAQIVAVALAVGGEVAVVPELGVVVGTVGSAVDAIQSVVASVLGVDLRGGRGLTVTLLLLTFGWYAFESWRERTTRRPDRPTRDDGVSGRTLVLAATALVVLGATAAMVLPGGTTAYSVVSAEFDDPGADVIPVGETETTTHPLGNGGVVPVVVFLEPSDPAVEVTPSPVTLPPRSGANATVSLTAPPQTGYFRHFVTEYRYLAVLPVPVLASLYDAHPWLPILVTDLLVAIPYYLVGVRLIGTDSVRLRERGRERPASVRIRRFVRRWY